MTETEVERGCKRFLLRLAPRLAASLDLRAAGIALPRRRLIALRQPRCRRSVRLRGRQHRRRWLIAHRHTASRTGGRVAGAAKGLRAARTRILPGGLREMQAFVTDHACGLQTQSPVAGRRLGHANERMPVEIDRALTFAAPDQHLQALNGDEQLQGLDPIDGDAQGIVMSEITKFGPVLALDRRDPMVFPLPVSVSLRPLDTFERK